VTLDKNRKKELASTYTQTFRPMGVYQLRNVHNGKIYVDGSMDLPGTLNRFNFCKQMNNCLHHELKQDWTAFGPEAFVFEELDQIKPHEEPAGDPAAAKQYRKEVDALLELWLEKLEPYGEKGYNKPKK